MAINQIVLLTLLLIAVLLIPQPQYDRVAFLDIGQGDAILFQDGSSQILVDGGPGANLFEPLSQELPWFDRYIDVIVLSHPQQDHMEGLLHLLARYDVGLIVFPQVTYESGIYQEWLGVLQRRNIPYRFAWLGQQFTVGDLKVKILGPQSSEENNEATQKDINNASTLMRVDFHEKAFLLTGDAEEPIEHLMVQTLPAELLDVDIMKAGHHGSNTASTTELINAASPDIVVISAGENNKFGHPHKEALEHIGDIPIARTDQDGTVRFWWMNNEWRIEKSGKSQLFQ